jgi:uncharacterized protein YraI
VWKPRRSPQIREGAVVQFYYCRGGYPLSTKRFLGQTGVVAARGTDQGGPKCLVRFGGGQAWVRPRYLRVISVPPRPPPGDR